MIQSPSLRIVFAGTPEFALPAFRALVDSPFTPLAVLTQPDRPAGRGRKVQPGPIKQAARDCNIPLYQPHSLKQAEARDWLAGWRPDLMVVVAYGLILPAEVLSIPRFGCWNIHASLLPRWRGAAPIQRAIEAGDRRTGVCIMQMDEGLDTGPIRSQREVEIARDDTAATLHDRLAVEGAAALLNCVRQLRDGTLPPAVAQSDSGITYAAKLEKKEAELDWNRDAVCLERRIRAFNPWPVAWCTLAGERTRIWTALALDYPPGPAPGTVVAAGPEGIDIATTRGLLRLKEVQRPGGRRVSAAEYLNARRLRPEDAGAA